MLRIAVLLGLYLLYATVTPDAYNILYTAPMAAAVIFNVYRLRSRYFSSMEAIHFMIFICFVISPLQAVDDGRFSPVSPVHRFYFPNDDVVLAHVIAFVFYVVFSIAVAFFERLPKKRVEINFDSSLVPILLAVWGLAFLLAVITGGGVENLFRSRYAKLKEGMSATNIIFTSVQFATTFLLASLALNAKTRTPLAMASAGIACLALLISQNPFNTPRYYLLAAWLPLVLMYFRGRIQSVWVYAFAVFAMIVIMPVLHFVGRLGLSLSDTLSAFDLNESLNQPFTDVFDMLVFEVNYFRSNSFHFGEKTLGLLLFFIPREIWDSKATLTGLDLGGLVMHYKLFGTDNLSLFVAGDFYADGGLIAVAMGAVLIAFLIYFFIYRKTVILNGFNMKEFIFIAAVPILVRGPLGANVGLTFFQLLTLAAFSAFVVSLGKPTKSTAPMPRPRKFMEPTSSG